MQAMGGMTMDPDGVKRGSKRRHMECVGQANQLSTDVADHGSTAKTRNRNVVGKHYEAARGSGALHKGGFIIKHVGSGPTVNDEVEGSIVADTDAPG